MIRQREEWYECFKQRDIYPKCFGYPPKFGGYTTLMSYMNELDDIAKIRS